MLLRDALLLADSFFYLLPPHPTLFIFIYSFFHWGWMKVHKLQLRGELKCENCKRNNFSFVNIVRERPRVVHGGCQTMEARLNIYSIYVSLIMVCNYFCLLFYKKEKRGWKSEHVFIRAYCLGNLGRLKQRRDNRGHQYCGLLLQYRDTKHNDERSA